MASIPAYNDFGKQTKDVVGSKFQFDQKLILSGKSFDGVSFNINSVNKGDQVTAEAKGSYKAKNVSFDTTVTSAGQAKTSISHSNLTPGLKLSLSGTVPDINSATLNVDYAQQYFNLKTSLGLTSTPKMEVSLATGYQGFLVGSDIGYDTAKQAVSKWSVALGYAVSDWSGTVMLTDKGDAIKAQVAHKMSPTSTAAAEVQQTLSTSNTTFTVGYQTKLPSGALAKVKLNNMGIMAMLYEHNISSGAKVAACYEVDVTDLDKAPRYGFSVDLSS
eukprot:TRINITY_DN9404_c0_g1_i1.p1 TRINITY_DN9404_c0_g1~~TRINITY_DN9404_c0_g1_i1.p1  ORF type:complete len:274 (+),score=21.12 TRINITY_DN9404_c0_g1_i1:52-873(+)